MQKIYLLLLLMTCAVFTQERYVDEIFDEITVTSDLVYGSNISVFNVNNPTAEDLLFDFYEPANDTSSLRPLVLYVHTGSFLPPLIAGTNIPVNQTTTGTKTDSCAIEICTQLAKRGFAVASCTYRQGWSATSDNPDVRTQTLLEAYYRSVQDIRTAIRYIRMTADVQGNPYGIDVDKIAMLGQGSGGYTVYGCAGVDGPSDLEWPEISNQLTGEPLVDITVLGDVFATNTTEFCIPNHVGYDSDFHFGMNMGGANGTINWLDENSPALAGIHPPNDPFAPYYDGDVTVPTTGEFVITVNGTWNSINDANEKGINDVLLNANFQDPVSIRAREVNEGVENVFPVILPATESSGPWDWWDVDLWSGIGVLGVPGVNIHDQSSSFNQNMSKEKALTYIDTTLQFFIPRAMVALQIEGFEQFVGTSIETLDQSSISILPTTSNNFIRINNLSQRGIESVTLIDINGRIVFHEDNLNQVLYNLDVSHFNVGLYNVKVVTDEGVRIEKILVQN